jgi:hypothetical protein
MVFFSKVGNGAARNYSGFQQFALAGLAEEN